jgi:hypothetical protein
MKKVIVSFLVLFVAGGGFGIAVADEKDDKMDMRVRPQVSYAPGSVVISVWVPPLPDNRALVIEADSGLFFRSSHVQLDGDNAPRSHNLVLNNLPPGEYQITATLQDTEGVKTELRRNATVLGSTDPYPHR